ncbi:unnamed protein product [Clonostachys rhizophaga]|uniref:Secreted protein n=1 Tax=Clonostachys rhizophaga TaxID=160324 RepID=A0A9N9VGV7_9HYPO|nr:unnamed protein product [Clonostachys rhizophaga]
MQLSSLFPTLLLAACAKAIPTDDNIAKTPANGQSNAGPVNVSADELLADAGMDSNPGCSPWYNWYGTGRWTYTEVQFCFYQRSTSTVAVVAQREAQYYWGAAWYYARGHEFSWNIKGTIVNGGDFEGSGKGPGPTEYYVFPEKVPAGTYAVSLNYNQVGPYWENDAAIDESAQFSIVLGS